MSDTTQARLFTPLTLGPQTLRNRIIIAPMCQYSAHNSEATDWHSMHWGNLMASGAGALILEATAVEPEGRISPADLGLWDARTETAIGSRLQNILAWSEMPVLVQLAHAGRKASSAPPWKGGHLLPPGGGGWHPIAPSAVPHGENEPPPQAMSAHDLVRVRDAFAASARRAKSLGLAGIEIHAAHGYLLHQFLSPLSNHRTDAYGGSLNNRMRFTLEVFEAVREAAGDGMTVGIRVSATDWVDGGLVVDDVIALAQALKSRSCDFIHVSSGGLSPKQQIPLGPGYQVDLADRIRKATGLTTIAVGLITEARQAEAILQSGQADAIALARAMLYDPRWPWHAAAELGATVQAPPQYWRCQPRGLGQLFENVVMGQR